jgi:hypothetical protein
MTGKNWVALQPLPENESISHCELCSGMRDLDGTLLTDYDHFFLFPFERMVPIGRVEKAAFKGVGPQYFAFF